MVAKLKPEFALCALGNLDETEVERYMQTGLYVMEPKIDGVRVMIIKNQDSVQIVTRGGTNCAIKFPQIVADVRTSAHKKLILDGELFSPTLRFVDVQRAIQSHNPYEDLIVEFLAFDVLANTHDETVNYTYTLRHTILQDICNNSQLNYVPNHQDLAHTNPMELYAFQKQQGYEGVVIKKTSAIYTPGRSKNFLRSKFKSTLSVMPLDVTGERTVSCGVWTTNGCEAVVVCNLLVPDDDLVLMLNQDLNVVLEIEAYGVSETGKLRHPVYKGMRFDTDLLSCTQDQLEQLRLY